MKPTHDSIAPGAGHRSGLVRTALVIPFAAVLFFGCKDQKSGETGANANATPSTNSAASYSRLPEKIKVKTPADAEVLKIKPRDYGLKLEFGGQVWKGEDKSGKRKYAPEGGATRYEIKTGDDGFKLRTPEGDLLWKVKFKSDKVKISDNEESRDPYQLKNKGDKVKIYDDETEIGAVKFYDDKTKVKDAGDAERFSIKPPLRTGAYGVLLMDRIPEAARYILVAELLARGK